MKADTEGIENLVSSLTCKEHLLNDLQQYLAARRDQVILHRFAPPSSHILRSVCSVSHSIWHSLSLLLVQLRCIHICMTVHHTLRHAALVRMTFWNLTNSYNMNLAITCLISWAPMRVIMTWYSVWQDGTELRTYVAVVAEQVVGVSIVRAEEDIEYIRSHYNIEDFIYFNHHGRTEHAHLHHFALNPIFNHFSKHFMKEILRKSHKTSMYYPVFAPSSTSKVSCPIYHSIQSAD